MYPSGTRRFEVTLTVDLADFTSRTARQAFLLFLELEARRLPDAALRDAREAFYETQFEVESVRVTETDYAAGDGAMTGHPRHGEACTSYCCAP
jgi:hypothetical protein